MTATDKCETTGFPKLNRGYDRAFRVNRLGLDLVVSIGNYAHGPVPQMVRHIERVQLADSPSTRIHLGYRMGANRLIEYLQTRRAIGVNHVALNLRFNQADIETTMKRLTEQVLPKLNS